ncbi:hypothetical protein LIER_22218 [Lithospermum erythrorhizon]|uniref:Uncharacterized protein n=1 Tax=Lithospermum erythrorhizon TaxID=34254 RepID=A0AAV3QT07_LITER
MIPPFLRAFHWDHQGTYVPIPGPVGPSRRGAYLYGASPANYVLVPRLACPATLFERASTCRRKAVIASGGGAGAAASRDVASWRLYCPVSGSFPLCTRGVSV